MANQWEHNVPTEEIGDYILEYAGEELVTGKGWGAYLTIYATSSNPAHRNCVFTKRRVCLDTDYLTREAAEESARASGIEKIGGTSSNRP